MSAEKTTQEIQQTTTDAAVIQITTQLAEFDKVAAGIGELEHKYKGIVYEVHTSRAMEAAKAARQAIRAPRYAIENMRKALKAPVLELGRQIDNRANEIKTALFAAIYQKAKPKSLRQVVQAFITRESDCGLDLYAILEALGWDDFNMDRVEAELSKLSDAEFMRFVHVLQYEDELSTYSGTPTRMTDAAKSLGINAEKLLDEPPAQTKPPAPKKKAAKAKKAARKAK